MHNNPVTASYEAVERMARERLPPDVAEKWVTLLRPAARLKQASPGEPVVGQLGGQPILHEDAVWPMWEGHGPLAFVCSIECGALASMQLDIAVPSAGRLAFFFIEDAADSLVIYQRPESLAGARVVYTPPGVSALPRSSPGRTKPYPRINLSAERIATYPNFEHPALIRSFRAAADDRRKFLEHPVNEDSFVEALWDLETGPRHQIGGYATPVQGPVEYEIAIATRGGKADWLDPSLEAEALRWTLLLQIDSDDNANMMWGDVGTLYWMIQPGDLRARRFDAASFTWQCH